MPRRTAYYICLFKLLGNTIARNPEKAVIYAVKYKVLPYAANNNRYAPCHPKPLTGD